MELPCWRRGWSARGWRGVLADLSADAAVLAVELRSGLARAADPDAAVKMAAYMRDRFSFFGVSSPVSDQITRPIFAGHPMLTAEDALALAQWCWEQDERELHYVGCRQLRRVAKHLPAEALPEIRTLIEEKSWWDTIDTLAGHVVGPMVATHSPLISEMDHWIEDDNLWVARTAILHQLFYGTATDVDRLFGYCLRQATHPDFFIRKAIGWALRQYARTDPVRVRSFLAEHRAALSPLSVREATKHLS
jgi:3-methyladenine DNA glycosylase AlkD